MGRGARTWRLTTSTGAEHTFDFVVSAVGLFTQPTMPTLLEEEPFTGTVMHTARWDHSVDLTDKSVAVLGTGSTAAQLVPEVVKVARKVYSIQRSPTWVFPKPDRRVHRAREVGVRARPVRQEALPHPDVAAERVQHLGDRARQRQDPGVPRGGRADARADRRRPRTARARSPPKPRSAASDWCSPRTSSRRSRSPTSKWCPARRGRCALGPWSPRTAANSTWTSWCARPDTRPRTTSARST